MEPLPDPEPLPETHPADIIFEFAAWIKKLEVGIPDLHHLAGVFKEQYRD